MNSLILKSLCADELRVQGNLNEFLHSIPFKDIQMSLKQIAEQSAEDCVYFTKMPNIQMFAENVLLGKCNRSA